MWIADVIKYGLRRCIDQNVMLTNEEHVVSRDVGDRCCVIVERN
jgi:hypothetical protein